jgi:hypothetical protein
MLTSLIRFTKNVMRAEMESIFAIAAALLVLFTTMMDPYISVGIAVTLLVALGIYEFIKNKRSGIEIANRFERRAAK